MLGVTAEMNATRLAANEGMRGIACQGFAQVDSRDNLQGWLSHEVKAHERATAYENISQWTGERNQGESVTNGELFAVGCVRNICNSRKEKEYTGYGTGTQFQNLDRMVEMSFGKCRKCETNKDLPASADAVSGQNHPDGGTKGGLCNVEHIEGVLELRCQAEVRRMKS